jgi:hypothetical protein
MPNQVKLVKTYIPRDMFMLIFKKKSKPMFGRKKKADTKSMYFGTSQSVFIT